uniref:Transcriptional regulator, GntR family n=1 Tax=Cyanothece sp. (strain PCC 7425 / ATCC 29141) TaxID=395961 RepID=B8HY29_CYAP4
MVQFRIQAESEIPASTQLFNQISFAIAARQFPPGFRLPSTRQLAMQTGLHRNTISKVYERLEAAGLVEAQVGSGIYVRALGQESLTPAKQTQPQISIHEVVSQSLDTLVNLGYSLHQVKELLLAEIEARLQAGMRLLVSVPRHDRGAGELIVAELQQALDIPVQLAFFEDLEHLLEPNSSATLVTVRYFAGQADAIAKAKGVRIFPIDIYDYSRELDVIKNLPVGSCLGLVSLSSGTLGVAEVMIHSLRGEDVFVMTAQVDDSYKLRALVHSAQTIISDHASCATVKAAVHAASEELIRLPKLLCCESYIDIQSIQLLKRELGLG